MDTTGKRAGVDGVSLEEAERQGVAPFLEVITAELKAGGTNPSRCCGYTFPSRMAASGPWGFHR